MAAQWKICLDCNKEMVVYETSELVCQSCGMTKKLFGVAFDEAQLGSNRSPHLIPDLTLICTSFSKNAKSWKTSIQAYWTGEKCVPRRGIICWQTASINSGASTASRSTMSVFCTISFKLFLLKTGLEKKKSLSAFPPTFQKLQKPDVARKKGLKSGGRKSHGGEAFVVFCFQFCRYFHAVVADEVIHHLQFVKEGFFVERFASEVKPNRVNDFFVLNPGEVGFLAFFVVFLEASHRFHDEAQTSQRSEHDSVQSDGPGNR